MKFLVNRTDSVKIKIYCWEADDNIEASHVKSEIPKDVETEEIEFVFRKPGYADSNVIIRNSNFKTEGEDTTMNVTSFQENVLRSLLIDWDLKDDEDQKVSVNSISINNLVPNVARAAVAGVLDKIRI